MSRYLLLLMPFCFYTVSSYSQHYYKDIITNKQVAADMETYKKKKVHQVKLKSFEDDGSPSRGFWCERKISRDYKKTELLTKSAISGASVFNSFFNDKGMIIKTVDSSALASSTNHFNYDNKDRLISITSVIRSSDDDFVNEIREEHLYQYNDEDIPVKMILVKNGKDSTTFLFQTDERNNVAIEKDTRTGRKYYYYYDEKNRLTDIVHANERTEKLLPDYMFQYNNAGLITQMTTTEEGGNYYYIWKYAYDDGLRTMEKCYSKEKRLMGTIEYDYK